MCFQEFLNYNCSVLILVVHHQVEVQEALDHVVAVRVVLQVVVVAQVAHLQQLPLQIDHVQLLLVPLVYHVEWVVLVSWIADALPGN